MGGTSAAEDPQIVMTLAAEHTESCERKPIEGTSPAEHTGPFSLQMDLVIERISATEHMEVEETSEAEPRKSEGTSAVQHMGPISLQMDLVIGPTSAAEHMEIEVASVAAEHTEIEGTSAGPEHTEIEVTSTALAESMEKEGTLDAEHMGSFELLISQLIKETEDTETTEIPKVAHWPKNSIFRVPEHIRSSSERNFEPKLVSIGPYYHGRENLKRMEDLKIHCIQEILKMLRIGQKRTTMPHGFIYRSSDIKLKKKVPAIHGSFVPQFMALGTKARAYFKEEFDHSPENFVKMLFLDSCFVIRTMFAFSKQLQESMSFLDVHKKEVRSDLLLLDNQIPLFFIKEVYESFLTVLKDQTLPSFDTVLEHFISLDMPWTINHAAMKSSKDAAHLLDLYWRCSLPPQMYLKLTRFKRDHPEQKEYCSNVAEMHLSDNAPMVIANATELHKMVGIEFKKFKEKPHMDVIFSKGIMRMPRLKIDSRQITLLRNLIAFENCISPSMRCISCYMKLMDALIDSEKDVKLLQKSGVLYNTLSNHEMAATIFNDIGNFCFIDNNTNPFSGLYKNVQEYYDSNWNRRWTSLQHNYFSSPWTGISVVAAIILLILSVLQTFYAIYGSYRLKN